ncbi:MAG: hypothetical protein JSR63_05765 [Proteobacteria bacterium]|nr:hypothetical protein [Pseudomonadota bacterium]
MAENRAGPPQELSVLEADGLLAKHGELMNSQALATFFKFGSDRSFRRSAEQGTLPVRVFRIQGRKGWFARTVDVAQWLITVGQVPNKTRGPNNRPQEGGAE